MSQPRSKNIESPKHFDEVVKNAIDFLERAVQAINAGDFRFSSVFFYQAVELFVKARLLHEHWSLVVSDVDKADLTKFEKGDFASVGLDDAVQRLKNIAGVDISSSLAEFRLVRARRNRVIHFHASDTPGTTSLSPPPQTTGGPLFAGQSTAVADFVREQCVAWYKLHRLIVKDWAVEFAAYRPQIERLDTRMRALRPYLQARFELQKNDLANLSLGSVHECDACGYPSSERKEEFKGLTDSKCHVCGSTARAFHFDCPNDGCSGQIQMSDDGSSQCNVCHEEMTLDDLIDHFMPTRSRRDGPEGDAVYCGDCGTFHSAGGTVVLIEEADKYLCLACLSDFDEVSRCECCDAPTTEDTEDSAWQGCGQCDGPSYRDRD